MDVPAARESAAVAAVRALGVMGVQVRDRRTGAPRGRAQVLAWLPATDATLERLARLEQALPDARTSWRDIPVTWDPGPAAHPLGRRFAVAGPGGSLPGRETIVIEAALAFGDGLHPTTALCVEALEDTVVPGASVLDVGTGTGVLAVVAARLGAGPVAACDIDPLAVWAAERTASVNRVDLRVTPDLPAGRYDIVIANLYLEPLLALTPELLARRKPGGALIVSGFREDAEGRVRAGLGDADATRRDGWVCLTTRG